MLALIDGDIAAYRAAAATQKSLAWDDDAPTIWANPAEAIKSALETIRLWADAVGAHKSIVMLTGDGNFRKAIFPAYKSNRSGVARPVALKAVREAIKDAFQTAIVDGLEADDLLGMMLTTPRARGRAVCVTMDKDLRGVPGLHLSPLKDRQPVFVGEADANRWWFTQALTGDASDGYPGCPKVGPKRAAKLLEGWDGMDLAAGLEIVSTAFQGAGMGHAEALTSLRVSRILRAGDYCKIKREVALWHPTTPEILKLP